MIALNEKEFAEKCIEQRTIYGTVSQTLLILAKYYLHNRHLTEHETKERLIDFLMFSMDNYSDQWEDRMDKIITYAREKTLCEIESIAITKNEIKKIQSLNNKTQERLLFTLLCIAKANNAKNPKNNGWVNYDLRTIFNLARIQCKPIDRLLRMGELIDSGLVNISMKSDVNNFLVPFIEEGGTPEIIVSDFREIGYIYRRYCGENFTRCLECGILFHNNKNGTKKYCSNCSKYNPQRYKFATCQKCGKEFLVHAKNNKSSLCIDCLREKNF